MFGRLKLKIEEWKKMYDYLYTLVIGNTNYKNIGSADSSCQIGRGGAYFPELIQMEHHSRLQNLNNLIASQGKLIIKKYASVSSQCIIIPEAHIPTVGLPQFLSITHINDHINDIIVNEDAWVGAGSILLSKCEIGRGAVIGAGSIVSKKIPPYAVAVGSPTKIVAARFTIEQILEHERILYPPEERMSREELEELFKTYYDGLRTIGTSEMSDEDQEKLRKAKEEFGIKDYSVE